jgi:hypothetical protein
MSFKRDYYFEHCPSPWRENLFPSSVAEEGSRALSWDRQGELVSTSGPAHYSIRASEYEQPTARLSESGSRKFATISLQFV